MSTLFRFLSKFLDKRIIRIPSIYKPLQIAGRSGEGEFGHCCSVQGEDPIEYCGRSRRRAQLRAAFHFDPPETAGQSGDARKARRQTSHRHFGRGSDSVGHCVRSPFYQSLGLSIERTVISFRIIHISQPEIKGSCSLSLPVEKHSIDCY